MQIASLPSLHTENESKPTGSHSLMTSLMFVILVTSHICVSLATKDREGSDQGRSHEDEKEKSHQHDVG
jgi:hypothetical protein